MGKHTTSASRPPTHSAASQRRCTPTSPHVSLGVNPHKWQLLIWVSFVQDLTLILLQHLSLGPCPPQHVAVDLQCGSRTAVLSWEERSDVELYVASAIKTSGGEVQECNSTGSTCQFPSLDCGETYKFTVTAHSQGCCSPASSAVFIQTGTAEARQVYLSYSAVKSN